MRLWGERLIGLFKYLLSIFMMYAGIATMFLPPTGIDGPLGIIYDYRISLVIIGAIFFISGFMLFYGKVRRSRRWTGWGLMAIYLCYLFAAILQFVAFPSMPSQWVGNIIGAIICGALWLRWKFKTSYVNPKHFRDMRFER